MILGYIVMTWWVFAGENPRFFGIGPNFDTFESVQMACSFERAIRARNEKARTQVFVVEAQAVECEATLDPAAQKCLIRDGLKIKKGECTPRPEYVFTPWDDPK